MFKCSRQYWLMGVAFHGPYTNNSTTIRNLQLVLNVKEQDDEQKILASRSKLCRVKLPAIIMPIFFDFPIKLESDKFYKISMTFSTPTNNNEDQNELQEWPAYVIQYEKCATVIEAFGQFTFAEELCVHQDLPNKFAYIQCGQIRYLYFWPMYNDE
jgi:hypothetical protein